MSRVMHTCKNRLDTWIERLSHTHKNKQQYNILKLMNGDYLNLDLIVVGTNGRKSN